MSQIPNDPLLTTAETAKEIGVAPGTLEVWRSSKRYNLAYIKVGSKVRYRQSAVFQFLESRTVTAA
jgi:hypothetical protein